MVFSFLKSVKNLYSGCKETLQKNTVVLYYFN
jgi:hypothetical protein